MMEWWASMGVFCIVRRIGAAVLVVATGMGETALPAPPETTSPPVLDSRELMRLGGIDAAAWARFQDGRPWSEPERETLQKILFRLSGLPAGDVEQLARPGFDLKRLANDPSAYRGEVVRLRGRIRTIRALPLPEEMARRFGLKHYYRAEVTLDGVPQAVIVYARTVPKQWQSGGSVNEPGGAYGMFVKLEGDGGDETSPRPAFAAARVAVYPEDRLLGRLGMDVGLLDDLADRRPLRAEERECFYQALAAAARSEPGQLRKTAARRLRQRGLTGDSVVPLFNDPRRARGELVLLSGAARRVLRVRVDEPDVQRRFGIDHYYEIYLYTGDSQGNPLVFCVTHLPEGFPTGDGPDYGESVTVAGFFLKSWAYASARTEEESPEGERPGPLQLAPLLVGRDVVWNRETTATGRTSLGDIAVGGVLLLVLVGVWIWLLRASRVGGRAVPRPENLSGAFELPGKPGQEAAPADPRFDFDKREANNSSDP